jgi:hypothetical protein
MNMCGYLQQIRYTPVGEYLRLLILRRLARGPAPVEEVDELARRAVERLGIRYSLFFTYSARLFACHL